MILYILRHADKEPGDFYKPSLRHQDPPLSQAGCRAARKFCERVSIEKPAAIYVSGYQRTLQTIEPLARNTGLVPRVDERLNEIDNGQVGEMSEAEFRQAFPLEWQAYSGRSADFRFPGGECGQEAQNRIVDFVGEKIQQHSEETIMIVSHDGLIRLWLCHVLGMPVYRRSDFQTDLCGLTELNYLEEQRSWKLLRFNQVLG